MRPIYTAPAREAANWHWIASRKSGRLTCGFLLRPRLSRFHPQHFVADWPLQNPLITHTLLEVVSCGKAILRPSGDGTPYTMPGDFSSSHECP